METFGKRLKGLRKHHDLTQKNLATKLGIGQTTIANYENDSRFPNHDILNQFANFFNVSIDYLVGRNNAINLDKPTDIKDRIIKDFTIDYQATVETYFNNLMEGNGEKAYNTLIELVKRGISLEDIYINVLEPSLIKVGALWEQNKLSVGEEHYFSEATKKLMSKLHFHYPIVKHKGYNALFICANGERHSIGLRMVSDALEQDGWKVYFLGTDLPIDSIIHMIREKNIDLIALSSTMDYNLNSVKSIIDNIRLSNVKEDIKFIVGGRPFNIDNSILNFVNGDGYASNCKDAVNVANELMKD